MADTYSADCSPDGALAGVLRGVLGDRLSAAETVRDQHGHDESHHAAYAPDLVAFPNSTDEVSAIVRACAGARVPVIPFGAGTGLEGGVAARSGGVCIDTAGLDRIREIRPGDMDATVEAGVRRLRLNEELRDTGLFFPVDPGADASIGGMAATGASGTNAVRYGTMRENVLNLTVVLADGRVIRTGGRARKSAAGYDLTRLFVGAEGTLGVITQATVRLHGLPEAVSAAVCAFATVEAAVAACIATIQCGIPIARIELMDEVQMDACIRYAGLDYEAAPTLFLEFNGTARAVREQAEAVEAIAAEHGGADFRWAERTEDRTRLWQARHDALYAALALRPGARAWSTDVCVPIGALAQCIAETRADIDASGAMATMLGHVGDGNFHVIFLLDPDRPEEFAEAERLNDRMVARAIALDGTCSGEHGVGLGKQGALAQEHGEALTVMRAVKHALDPD
ncbi:MAG: FAD-linked oxidase C-terminal domain-containing protein, partial [Alphaproteobacteria bacterium]